MIRFSVCLLIFSAILLSGPNSLLAQEQYSFEEVTEGQITEALTKTAPLRFLPTSPLYFAILAKESLTRFLKPSSVKKSGFDLVVAGKRLKEVYLLVDKNDLKRASQTLKGYNKQMEKMTSQLEKAKSQNQDVSSLVNEIVEDLKFHEILLAAINKKYQLFEGQYNFHENLSGAVLNFKKAVTSIDKLKPGVKDRFKI